MLDRFGEGTTVANKEHIKRLKQGVPQWNAWREQFPGTGADLRGADLRGARLGGANLSRANLSGANLLNASLNTSNLMGAKLNRANLVGARLGRANLYRANLTGAKLGGANLNRAILMGAKLNRAVLIGANLMEAKLGGADLKGATLGNTILGNVDLSAVVGLEACDHVAPSIIDFRTLEISKSLPLMFLRGVGLPETLIDYLPSLLNQAIRYYSCFISYSKKDDDFAKRIHADLQSNGVRCWFAPHDMPIGGKILDEIDDSIRLRDKLLLILSRHSIKSEWVEDEVTTAFEEERKRGQLVLFPIRLDDSVLTTDEPWAAKLRARNIGDFAGWKEHDNYQETFKRVLRDLTQARSNKAHE